MKLTHVLSVLFLAAAPLSNFAHAASTATASVSIVEIVLTDLDPNDGITPSLQVLPLEWGESSAGVNYYIPAPGPGSVWTYETSKDPLAPLQTELALGPVFAGTATKGGTSLDTLSIASALTVSASDLRDSRSSAQSLVHLVLSPNTNMSITFDFDVQAHSVPTDSDRAGATGFVFINDLRFSRPSPDSVDMQHGYTESAAGNGGKSGNFRFTGGLNSGEQARDLVFQMYVESRIAPVPEPHTYAMMLAGLLIAGAASRRRG